MNPAKMENSTTVFLILEYKWSDGFLSNCATIYFLEMLKNYVFESSAVIKLINMLITGRYRENRILSSHYADVLKYLCR